MAANSLNTCFIDTNIIMYIYNIENFPDFKNIVENIYTNVLIHEKVYHELSESQQKFVDDKISSDLWEMFDESKLTDPEKTLYNSNLTKIAEKLEEIDIRRGKLDEDGLGEIYSLSAANVLEAEYICSNDFSIETVIQELDLTVIIDENEDEEEEVLMKQHTYLDLCMLAHENGLMKRKDLFKCYKIAYSNLHASNSYAYNKKLEEFNEKIPIDSN